MRRLAIVASHPVQYQVPWFRALSAVTDLDVLYCHRQDGRGQADAGFAQSFEWDVPLFDGYRFRWLKNVSSAPGVESFGGCDTPDVATELAGGRFDACLVSGWYLKSYLQAIAACRRLGIPVLVRGDSHLRMPVSLARRLAKYVPYRWFLNRIDRHLYVGAANRAYLRHYGVPEYKLYFAPHFVDNEFFRSRAARAEHSGLAARIRADAAVGEGELLFLFVGKFIDKKRPFDFVDAIERAFGTARVRGLMVGSGPLEGEIRRRISAARIPISLAGFRNQSELPAYYAAADALVLPSDGRETWGLVVNEAMACGRPAVVSDAVGCADDLIDRDTTGEIYRAGNVPALAEAVGSMARRLRADREPIRRSVCEKVQRYSVAEASHGLLAAVNH